MLEPCRRESSVKMNYQADIYAAATGNLQPHWQSRCAGQTGRPGRETSEAHLSGEDLLLRAGDHDVEDPTETYRRGRHPDGWKERVH